MNKLATYFPDDGVFESKGGFKYTVGNDKEDLILIMHNAARLAEGEIGLNEFLTIIKADYDFIYKGEKS